MRSNAARLLVATGALLAVSGCDSFFGPTSPDANWRVHDRGRFTFYVRPGSFAEQHVDTFGTVLDNQLAVSVSRLGLHYDGRISVFLHDSGADAGFEGDGGDHSGVAYPETETVRAACVPPLDDNLFALLSHEVNHVIVRNGLGRAGTTFMNEGLASALLSERHHALGPTFYYGWTAARRGQLPPLSSLVDDDLWGSFEQSVAYSTSASFLAYLIETHGASSVREIYYASSSGFRQRFAEVIGKPLETAESEWLAFCDERAGAGAGTGAGTGAGGGGR
jgi:hypothetical protein